MNAREKLAELRELAEKATPGPWKLWGMSVLADPVGDSNVDTALPIAHTTDAHRGMRTFNAQMIATSRAELPKLVAALEAVLDLADMYDAEACDLEDARRVIEEKLR